MLQCDSNMRAKNPKFFCRRPRSIGPKYSTLQSLSGSQELHMSSQPPLLPSSGGGPGGPSSAMGSTFSKFNSLDRRALMSRWVHTQ